MTTKKHRFEYYIFYRKKIRKQNWSFVGSGTGSVSSIPGGGSGSTSRSK